MAEKEDSVVVHGVATNWADKFRMWS